MLAIATSLLLIGQAAAGLLGGNVVVRREDSTEERMRRYADSIVEPIERRQFMSKSGENLTEWETNTQTKCMTNLRGLNGVANNPSGMAVCYNLPFLDNTTGVFEADLRLFMVAPATGAFANIPSQNVQVGLAYNGATVSAVNASALKARSEGESLISWPRNANGKRATEPVLIQSYTFVGQINKNLLSTPMGTAALQKVLVPVVTLTGIDAVGAKVNTSLSSDQATFVNGVFAAQLTPTQSRLQPPIQTLVVVGNDPFIVPGVKILIFPIGMVITGIWSALLVGTIAWGTVGRMQFREQFRRRTARAMKGDQARI